MKMAIAPVLLLMFGCTMGPNYRRPPISEPGSYTRSDVSGTTASIDVPGGEAQHLSYGKDIPHDWWTLFQSPQLNALVEQCLNANPTIPAARQALQQARELVAAQRALFYPTVQAGTLPSYQRVSATLSQPLNSN